MKSEEIFTKGFWRMSSQKYFVPEALSSGVSERIQIENCSSSGGIQYEFGFKWHKLNHERTCASLEIFDDAFIALKDNKQLFEALPKLNNPTSDDIHKLLLQLGYVDFSDTKLYQKKNDE